MSNRLIKPRLIIYLITSVYKRSAHFTLLASLISPVVLVVVLNSIPGLAYFLEGYLKNIGESRISIISQSNISSQCIEVYLDKAYLDKWGEVAVIYSVELNNVFQDLIISYTNCNITNATISLAKEIYEGLGKPCGIKLKEDGSFREYSVLYLHRDLDAIIVLNTTSPTRRGFLKQYLCTVPEVYILRRTFKDLEEEILGFINTWLWLLLVASVPSIYIASLKTLRNLGNELKTLINTGLDHTAIVLHATLSLTFIGLISVVFLTAISIVIVHAGTTVLSSSVLMLIPTFRYGQIFAYEIIIFIQVFLTALIASLKVVQSELL